MHQCVELRSGKFLEYALTPPLEYVLSATYGLRASPQVSKGEHSEANNQIYVSIKAIRIRCQTIVIKHQMRIVLRLTSIYRAFLHDQYNVRAPSDHRHRCAATTRSLIQSE